MKKLLIFTAILSITISCMAQTGTGWQRIGAKQNFIDSAAFSKDINITGSMRKGGVTITSTAGEMNALQGILVTSTQINMLSGASGNIQTQLNGKLAIADTSGMLNPYIARGDTAAMLNPYIARGDTTSMLDRYIARGDTALMLGPYALDSQVALKENALGNPSVNGYVLASTTGGVRSWTAQLAMIYPATGIALSSGSGWSGSITNNSANWNTAYGWGNHASAGYAPLASPTFTGTPRISTDTVATRAYARANGMVYPAAGIPLSTGTGWGTPITNNSTNWNTSYTERRQWDGGATNLVAATGRTSLGATTAGGSLFTIANPSAISFLRINADNSVTALSDVNFKTALALNNVTNESKATMFASPTFTGTVTIPTPFTLGSTSVTATGTQINYLAGTNGITGAGQITLNGSPVFTGTMTLAPNISLVTGAQMSWNAGDVTLTHSTDQLTIGGGNFSLGTGTLFLTGSIGNTTTRVTKGWFTDIESTNYPTVGGTSIATTFAPKASPTFTGTVTLPGTTSIGNLSSTEIGYLSEVTSDVQNQINGKEPGLGNPSVSGYVLSSTTGGTRSWIAPGTGGGMVYPGAGIAVSTGTAWGTSLTDNSTNWTAGYTERRQWDGGSTNLVAATGRTSLGATTVGTNLFTLTNPSAIRYLRTNADNTITALSAAQVKTDLALTAADVGLGNVTNEAKATMFNNPTFTGAVTIPSPFTIGSTSMTTTGTQLNYLNAANGTTGTGSLVFSASPTFTGTVTGSFSGNITGNAGTVTGFTRNAGTLTLSGGHGLTVTTTGTTSVTMPTSGTLATTANLSSYAPLISPTFEGTVTLPLATSIGTVSSTEIGYIDGLNGTAASRQDINDTMDVYLADAVEVIAQKDSTGYAAGNYVTHTQLDAAPSTLFEDLKGFGFDGKAIPVGVGELLSTYIDVVDNQGFAQLFHLREAMTITGVKFIMNRAGDYTADQYNGVGLYKLEESTLTKVAESTNDGDFWKGASYTKQTKPFSTPYNAAPGYYYVIGLHNNSASVTSARFYCWNPCTGVNNLFTVTSKRIVGNTRTSNALAATYTLSDLYGDVASNIFGYWLY